MLGNVPSKYIFKISLKKWEIVLNHPKAIILSCTSQKKLFLSVSPDFNMSYQNPARTIQYLVYMERLP